MRPLAARDCKFESERKGAEYRDQYSTKLHPLDSAGLNDVLRNHHQERTYCFVTQSTITEFYRLAVAQRRHAQATVLTNRKDLQSSGVSRE